MKTTFRSKQPPWYVNVFLRRSPERSWNAELTLLGPMTEDEKLAEEQLKEEVKRQEEVQAALKTTKVNGTAANGNNPNAPAA